MENNQDNSEVHDESSILLSHILRTSILVHANHPAEKECNTLFLYSLLHKSAELAKSSWPDDNYRKLLSFTRKPALFLNIEAELPTSEWLACLNLLIKSHIAPRLIAHYNNYYSIHQQDEGFFSHLLFAFHAKEVQPIDRLAVLHTCLNLGSTINLKDVNSAYELYGFGQELKTFIEARDHYRHISDEVTGAFPVTTFIFAQEVRVTPEVVHRLFANLIQTDQYVTDSTKENCVICSLGFFSVPLYLREDLRGLCQKFLGEFNPVDEALEKVPTVPSLLELTRNAVYEVIKANHEINHPLDFQELVNALNVPSLLKNVLKFNKRIY